MRTLFNSTAKFFFIFGALIALVAANVHLWKKDQKQEFDIKALQSEVDLQRLENSKLAEKNDDLRQKINSLKLGSMEMIEEEARKGFGMVGEGETFYHLDDKIKSKKK